MAEGLTSTPVLDANRAMLADLRVKFAAYFHSHYGGKTYRSKPALAKFTVPDPAETPGEPAAVLIIRPAFVGRRGAVKVAEGHLALALRYGRSERIAVALPPDNSAFLWRCCGETVASDAARLVRVVGRFLEDPAAALASGADHCAFCGHMLTDPESRARGIGPECYGRFGDLLNFMVPAPANS